MSADDNSRLIWIDCRVFWADMQFVCVRESDKLVVQSEINDMPKEFWVECIELTFNGAYIGDPEAVYDYMFDNHPTHKAVLDAVHRASIELSDLRSY